MVRALRLFPLVLPLCLLASEARGGPPTGQPTPAPAKAAAPARPAAPVTSAAASAAPSATAAAAPAAPATDSDKADALYRASVEAGKAEKWQEAYELLSEAVRLKQSHDILGNLGTTEFRLGRYRDAAEHFTASLRLYPVNGRPEGKAFSAALLDEAKTLVGTLVLKVTPPTAKVRVNGNEVAAAERDAVFVEAGDVVIEVGGLAGYESKRRVVKAEKGKVETVEMGLDPLGGAAQRNPIPGYVAGGIGAAGAIAGAVLLGVGFAQKSDVEAKMPRDENGKALCVRSADAGPERHPDCPALRSTEASAQAMANVGLPMMIAGGVVVAGAIAYLLWPASTPKPAGPTGRLIPTVGPQGAGFLWTGSF